MVKEYYRPIEKELGSVRKLVKTTISDNINFREIGEHLQKREGKYIRSAFILFLTKMFSGDVEKSIRFAASCELIHLATLLHDDVIDNSQKRRGIESTNFKYGNKFSILMGDFLYSRAFQLINSIELSEIFTELLNTSILMCEGEAMELSYVGNLDIKLEEYLEIIRLKTAVFFGCCGRGAAIISEKSGIDVDICEELGESFGMAFQLTDDMLDFFASEDKLGKPVMLDLKEKHYTMPVIKGFDDEKNGEKLKKLVQSSENIDENEIRRMLEESGSFDYTRDIIGNYVNRSKEILDSLEVVDGSLKEYMVSIVNFMSNRDY